MRFYLSNLENPFFRKFNSNAKRNCFEITSDEIKETIKTIPFDLKPTSLLTKKIAMVLRVQMMVVLQLIIK
jgi:hypothetical protein